jgi:hypothetical protein
MKETDYGKKVGQALKVVAKMHSQVSQLISDCDSLFPEYKSVFGTNATRDLTYSVHSDFWMAEGVYRYWFKEGSSVVGVTALFHPWEGELEQPLFVVGQINYLNVAPETVKEQCSPWHLWTAVTSWAPQPPRQGKVIELSDPDGKGTIPNMRLIVVPLFHIENLDDVKTMFRKLGVELSE